MMLSLFFAGADTPAMPVALDGVELLRAHAIESFDTCVVTAHTPAGGRLWFGTSTPAAKPSSRRSASRAPPARRAGVMNPRRGGAGRTASPTVAGCSTPMARAAR
ncbi:MAG: hypothetical protein WDM96_18345 [Lacunisphaera sp.]